MTFYSFMTQLGMAAQAIDIVYQLNAADQNDVGIYQQGAIAARKSLTFGPQDHCDVLLQGLTGPSGSWRFGTTISFCSRTRAGATCRPGPRSGPGAFCRIFAGQRIVLGEQVLTYQDLAFYFNAKKNVSLTQIYLRIDRMTRCGSRRIARAIRASR